MPLLGQMVQEGKQIFIPSRVWLKFPQLDKIVTPLPQEHGKE